MRQIAKRLLSGQDVRLELERLVSTEKISAGCVISLVGSLVRVCLRLADGKRDKMFDGPFEIVSGTGTLSQDGVHIHLSVADVEGKVIGGHLRYGCLVNTTVELVVKIFENVQFRRTPDATTGYDELVIIPVEAPASVGSHHAEPLPSIPPEYPLKVIGFFEGPWTCLSNFSAHKVVFEGEEYQTAEHAYQVAKFSDPEVRRRIRMAPSAYLARQYGQTEAGRAAPFDKVAVIKSVMRAKFLQHEDVQRALRASGSAVIEKNIIDCSFWGTGPDGTGQNVLGKIWMELRDEFFPKPL